MGSSRIKFATPLPPSCQLLTTIHWQLLNFSLVHFLPELGSSQLQCAKPLAPSCSLLATIGWKLLNFSLPVLLQLGTPHLVLLQLGTTRLKAFPKLAAVFRLLAVRLELLTPPLPFQYRLGLSLL